MVVKNELKTIVSDIADALIEVEKGGIHCKPYCPGIGPCDENLLVKKIADKLNSKKYHKVSVDATGHPDMQIEGSWALEFKIVRPYNDNGKEADNWSVKLIHPYEGNKSMLGDCLKLLNLKLPLQEKKGVIALAFQPNDNPPETQVLPLIEVFELIAKKIMRIKLGPRITENRKNLIHPVHQQMIVYGWEVKGRST